jgi:hypothetical protein
MVLKAGISISVGSDDVSLDAPAEKVQEGTSDPTSSFINDLSDKPGPNGDQGPIPQDPKNGNGKRTLSTQPSPARAGTKSGGGSNGSVSEWTAKIACYDFHYIDLICGGMRYPAFFGGYRIGHGICPSSGHLGSPGTIGPGNGSPSCASIYAGPGGPKCLPKQVSECGSSGQKKTPSTPLSQPMSNIASSSTPEQEAPQIIDYPMNTTVEDGDNDSEKTKLINSIQNRTVIGMFIDYLKPRSSDQMGTESEAGVSILKNEYARVFVKDLFTSIAIISTLNDPDKRQRIIAEYRNDGPDIYQQQVNKIFNLTQTPDPTKPTVDKYPVVQKVANPNQGALKVGITRYITPDITGTNESFTERQLQRDILNYEGIYTEYQPIGGATGG